MPKPTWSEYYLGIAEAASKRSSCERAKVGAAVVKNNRVVALGYNNAPAGKPGCESCPCRTSGVEPGAPYDGSDSGRCHALHAELNACIYADREDLTDSTLYVTRAPCTGCMKVIQAAGIAEVVYPSAVEGILVRWVRDWFEESGALKTEKTYSRASSYPVVEEIVEEWHGKTMSYPVPMSRTVYDEYRQEERGWQDVRVAFGEHVSNLIKNWERPR